MLTTLPINLDALVKTNQAIALLLSRAKLVYDEKCPTAATGLTHDGQIVVYVGEGFSKASVPKQVEALKHELAHILGSVWERAERLDPKIFSLFNIAHDAAIHEAGCCDVNILDKMFGTQVVTCERLKVDPAPAEDIYYELLKNPEQHNIQLVACCGRSEFLDQKQQAGEIQNVDAGSKLSDALKAAMGSQLYGNEPSQGRTLSGTLPPTPAWAQKLYQFLDDFNGEDRYPERSWQRGPSRRHEMIPGWPRVQPAKSALLFIDASGSMSDDMLLQAVAAAQSVGLNVQARIWSTFVSEQLPPEPGILRAEIEKHGGGTLAMKCAETIEHEKCVIWISDAESADGLPAERKGWVWVIVGNGEPRITRSPIGS